MKAVVYNQYGPPDVLQIANIEQPVPQDNQVLIRVQAVSLNPAEAHMRNGILMARLLGGKGLLRPKSMIVSGADIAGTIEVVGSGVSSYQVGDEVYGRRDPGGFAEFVCASEKPIALKPANLTCEQAAAIPTAGLTALQSLRDTGKIQAGQKVLINGAAGGLGTFSVQIARALGAEVSGVTSPRNLEMVRSLGAERVIDYTREDFTRDGQRYDLILDNVGNRSASDLLRALKPGGICVVTGFTSIGLLLQHLIRSRLAARGGGKKLTFMISHMSSEDLGILKEMVESGKLAPVIDRTFPLHEVSEAYRYMETKHARGKIVVRMA